jgi:hypothetical protein
VHRYGDASWRGGSVLVDDGLAGGMRAWPSGMRSTYLRTSEACDRKTKVDSNGVCSIAPGRKVHNTLAMVNRPHVYGLRM